MEGNETDFINLFVKLSKHRKKNPKLLSLLVI